MPPKGDAKKAVKKAAKAAKGDVKEAVKVPVKVPVKEVAKGDVKEAVKEDNDVNELSISKQRANKALKVVRDNKAAEERKVTEEENARKAKALAQKEIAEKALEEEKRKELLAAQKAAQAAQAAATAQAQAQAQAAATAQAQAAQKAQAAEEKKKLAEQKATQAQQAAPKEVEHKPEEKKIVVKVAKANVAVAPKDPLIQKDKPEEKVASNDIIDLKVYKTADELQGALSVLSNNIINIREKEKDRIGKMLVAITELLEKNASILGDNLKFITTFLKSDKYNKYVSSKETDFNKKKAILIYFINNIIYAITLSKIINANGDTEQDYCSKVVELFKFRFMKLRKYDGGQGDRDDAVKNGFINIRVQNDTNRHFGELTNEGSEIYISLNSNIYDLEYEVLEHLQKKFGYPTLEIKYKNAKDNFYNTKVELGNAANFEEKRDKTFKIYYNLYYCLGIFLERCLEIQLDAATNGVAANADIDKQTTETLKLYDAGAVYYKDINKLGETEKTEYIKGVKEAIAVFKAVKISGSEKTFDKALANLATIAGISGNAEAAKDVKAVKTSKDVKTAKTVKAGIEGLAY